MPYQGAQRKRGRDHLADLYATPARVVDMLNLAVGSTVTTTYRGDIWTSLVSIRLQGRSVRSRPISGDKRLISRNLVGDPNPALGDGFK